VVPDWEEKEAAGYGYDGETENWELPEEMVTPIAQHKYDNRIIIRLSNICHAYCQFCYEALRTLEKESNKPAFQREHWQATLDYLRAHEAVEEVILSGGEPLMHGDEQLDQVLGDLRALPRRLVLRIHTRALTFNPFRVTEQLASILAKHQVTAIGLHVSHPHELTAEFAEAVKRLQRAVPILFANMPLLGGINDRVEIIHELGMRLYAMGVVPHYLYHFMPYSPGGSALRTPVKRGLEIVRALKRRVSNLAVPEFVLPHHGGKHSLPIDPEPPSWGEDTKGHPVVRFVNWRGEHVSYPDAPDRGRP
jgi:lysine 2,3-aminomutase